MIYSPECNPDAAFMIEACGPILNGVSTSFRGQRQRGVDPTAEARS